MELNPLKTIALLALLMAAVLGLNAQSLKPSDDLYKEIAHQDSTLFNAFNSKNLDVIKQVLSEDLEFYHDRGGLSNYADNMEDFKKIFSDEPTLHRELIAGSMEVYPVKDYGAVQIASHSFCHLEDGKQHCGTFKFVHVWHKTPAGWKLARVVSYGH